MSASSFSLRLSASFVHLLQAPFTIDGDGAVYSPMWLWAKDIRSKRGWTKQQISLFSERVHVYAYLHSDEGAADADNATALFSELRDKGTAHRKAAKATSGLASFAAQAKKDGWSVAAELFQAKSKKYTTQGAAGGAPF